MRWSTSIIVGGTTSGTVQVSTVGIRALDRFHGRPGNPLVSTVEAAACLVCTVLALLLPLLAMALVVTGLIKGGRWSASPSHEGGGWRCFGAHEPSDLKTVNGEKSDGGW